MNQEVTKLKWFTIDFIRPALIKMERQAWEANQTRDVRFYRKYFTHDAVIVSPFGMVNRQTFLSNLERKTASFQSFTIERPRVIALGENCASISYTAIVQANRGGKSVSYSVYCTTVYVKAGEDWRAVIHQQTPAE
ncbi:MAG: nuclear transport factor 2 family protein [Chloroflexi bacterium]|nr:nuclear transport factor 2 family protein [Chloroflexota bacterium]